MTERRWEKFENELRIALPNIENVAVNKIKDKFMRLDKSFLISLEVKTLLKDTIDKINEDKRNAYKILLELKNTLKRWKKKRKINDDQNEIQNKVFIKEEEALVAEEIKSIEMQKKDATKDSVVSEISKDNVLSTKALDSGSRLREFNIFETFNFTNSTDLSSKKKQDNHLNTKPTDDSLQTANKSYSGKNCGAITKTLDVTKSTNSSNTKVSAEELSEMPQNDDSNKKEKVSTFNAKIQKKIDALEVQLQRFNAIIENREEEDMSLDQMGDENSSYVVLDKLKQHAVKIWKQIAKLRKEKASVKTNIFRKFSYDEMGYKELNKRVEEFVLNKKFPDYSDIRDLIQQFSQEKKWTITPQKISQLATEVFQGVGNKLKRLRIKDFEKYFGNHLTDKVRVTDDPIRNDENLRRSLIKSSIDGKEKLNAVFKNFELQQLDLKDDDEEVSDIGTNTDMDELSEYEDELVENNAKEIETNVEKNDNITVQNITNVVDDIIPKSNEAIKTVSETVNEDIQKEDDKIIQQQEPNPKQEQDEEVTTSTKNKTCDSPNLELITASNIKQDEEIDILVKKSSEIESQNNRFTALPPEKIIKPPQEPVKVLSEDISDDSLKELSNHTFQFNLDQLMNKEKSQYFNEVITIDDSEDESLNSLSSESSSSDEQVSISKSEHKSKTINSPSIPLVDDCKEKEDTENNDPKNSAYSSKMDGIMHATKPKEEIFITLDDSDEEPDAC